MKKRILANCLLLIVSLFVSFTCANAQRDTAITNLGVAGSTWKTFDLGSNKSAYGWITNDNASTGDSLFVAIGTTAYPDTAAGYRTTVLPGEVLEIKPRTMRYLRFKRAGSNDVSVRGVITR